MKKKNKRAMVAYYSDILFNTFRNIDMAHFIPLDNKLQKLIVAIDPVQNLNGFDNPWPEGGGVNKLNPNISFKSGYLKNDSGTEVADNGTGYTDEYIPVKPSTNYAVGDFVFVENYGRRVYFYDADKNWISRTGIQSSTTFSFTTPSNCYYIQFQIPITGSDLTGVQLVEGSTLPSTYYPYSNICPITGHSSVNVIVSTSTNPLDGTITNIPLGQTVYGGTLDVVRGVLTIDRVSDTFTKDSVWYAFATGTGNSSAVVQLSEYQNCYFITGNSSRNGAISSTGKEAQNYWTTGRINEELGSNGDMCFAYSSTGQLRFHRADVANITDLASFKENFPDTQIVYFLDTPIEISLTPMQINTIVGSWNYVWCDTGKIILIEA